LEEARLKDEEAMKLQTELEEAHRRMEENQRELEEARNAHSLLLEQKLEDARLKEEEMLRLEMETKEEREKMEENELELEEATISARSLPLEQTLEEDSQQANETSNLQTVHEEVCERMEESEHEVEEVGSIQTPVLEQNVKETGADDEDVVREHIEIVEAHQTMEENEVTLKYDSGSGQSSPVLVATVHDPLTADGANEDHSDVSENVERRGSSSSRSSSSSSNDSSPGLHSHHSSQRER